MAFSGGGKGIKSEINVTPLVDVVLVLLIIFMVVTPMLQRGKDVNLPMSKQVDEGKSADPLILSVTRDHQIFLEKNQIDSDSLERALADVVRRDPGKKILVKGDESLTVGEVREVMARARAGGASGVALAVQEKKQ
jgi:biopolymer transport protein ExbD